MNISRTKEIIAYYDRRINRLSNRLENEDNIIMQIRLRLAIRNCQRNRREYVLRIQEPFTNPLHGNLLTNGKEPDSLRMQADDDGWVTVNGTHILLGEEGTVKGGPENLRGKSFAKAKSQKKESGKSASTGEYSKTPISRGESTEHELSDNCKKAVMQVDRRNKKYEKIMKAERDGDIDEKIVEQFGDTTMTTDDFMEFCKQSDGWPDEDKMLDMVYTYSGDFKKAPVTARHDQLNKKLYTGQELTDDEQAIVDHFARCAQPMGKTVDLYRGVGADYLRSLTGGSDDFESLVGREITNKALLSTAPGVHSGFSGLDVVMKIKTPGDVAVCTTRDIGEGEIVIPAGSKMRVTSVNYAGESGVAVPRWSGRRTYEVDKMLGRERPIGMDAGSHKQYEIPTTGVSSMGIVMEVELIGYE